VSIYLFVGGLVTGFVVTTVRALVPVYRDHLRWKFYQHIYDHGGQRDLTAVAEALEHGDDNDQDD
jgi:hypothetical protein